MCDYEVELEIFKSSEKNNFNKTSGSLKSKQMLRSNIDSKYLYSFSKRIVRIEYPGLVKDALRAIDTLGGMHGIQMAVADSRNKLELHFHPENKFNKPSSADRELSPGILIIIKPSVDIDPINHTKYNYAVIGITSLNFTFHRICDFQYLPLVTTSRLAENIEYVYDKIIPDNLPTMEWFLSKQRSNQSNFYIPPNFARFDTSQNKLYLNAGERFGSNVRPEICKLIENIKPTKRSKHISTKQVSIFVNFQLPEVQIPDQPLTYTMELVKERNLEQTYKTVRKLFEERPIWTKIAIQYKTGIKSDHAKIVLPAVAYFCPIGPWRMTWVKYDYNPQKDFNSRIYQTLDYRIRATEGTKLKVNAKRSYASKTLFYVAPNNVKKVSLKDNMLSPKKNLVEERSYILRPTYIPPARQMFYQYCDILIPEIQEMVSRLPKIPVGTKCDSKNGWLPMNFTEQCREIVNKYVMDRVQEELLADTIKLQQQQSSLSETRYKDINEVSSTYCSKMLSNIKNGIYESVNITPVCDISKQNIDVNEDDVIDLREEIDGEELQQINADDVVNSMPERMDENSDDEHLSQSSDIDIDMEAVEEVNKMIAGIQEDEINVTLYLRENL